MPYLYLNSQGCQRVKHRCLTIRNYTAMIFRGVGGAVHLFLIRRALAACPLLISHDGRRFGTVCELDHEVAALKPGLVDLKGG